MDLQSLSNLFATTYNPDPNVQKAGELQIRKLAGQEGMVAGLLQIIASDNVDIATRQASAVYLKNRVYSGYYVESATREGLVPIPESDRQALKTSILHLLANSPSRSITLQLANALKNIAARDYPDHWPNLLDEVKRLLTSSEIREVGAGCVASLEIVRAFRFRQTSDIIPHLCAELLPILVKIAQNLLNSPPPNASQQEIAGILHYILKTYKTTIVLQLSKHQQSAESLVPWGTLLFQVVNLQIPKEAVPEDEEERERSEWWKAKKWAYGILGRLFHRYGNPSQLPSSMQKDYGEFAKHFVQAFAPEIFQVYLNQIQLFCSGQVWLSKKCQYQIFSFFTECVKPKSTWALLKPHYEYLVQSYVFPQLSFTPEKQELWNTDPIDYVRVVVDEYEAYDTPTSAATTFLLSLASNRTRSTFMSILAFINRVLQQKPPAPQRFGALNMTSALGSLIMRHPDVKGNMEHFVMQYVLNEFNAPPEEPYMRAVACEVLGTIEKAGLNWNDEQNLKVNFDAVARCLDDPELPVRIQASLALCELIIRHDSVKKAVAPQVGKVIQTLLKLSEESDLDILNNCMETMVEQYQTELLPVAAELTARLCETYTRLARESVTAEESAPAGDIDALISSGDVGEDKTFAAMGVAKTIGTIVSSVESSPEILAQIQEIIIPIIVLTLENKLLDLYDNAFDLVDSLTFKMKRISPNMWPIFELTYKLFMSEAVDFLDEMLPSLDNFVSYGTDVFRARPDYRKMILDIYTTSVTSDNLGENDAVNGCKLIESMLLNLRGHIDDALETIITTAWRIQGSAQTSALKLANLDVLVNCVLYNPAAALHIIEAIQPGASRTFFNTWFETINRVGGLPRVHDKKVTIMAICTLLELDPAAVPDAVKDGWPGIVAGALHVFKDLPKAIEERKAMQEMYDDDDDSSGDFDDAVLNMNEEDEDVWDQDSAYLEMLANEGARLRERTVKEAAGEDLSETSDESDILEELGFISPLDNVDPYVTFKQALTTFQMKNPQSYQVATTSLNPEQQTLLMEVMRIAEEHAQQAGQA
ncbi:ARM repeat-containing protein [Panus rudis PR-1116 ss-1]|nr:ARM repeat-containing protein [Panus rudis PR-1116 ss-1]